MTNITPELIKTLITQNGGLFVPECITDAISSCVSSSPDIIREEGERLKKLYESYEKNMEPIKIDYSGDGTIDAYSVYYLPRNSLVPKAAILCCAYHPALQNLPDKLRVLDLGSGTGGVVLGLLDLFHDEALSGTSLDITALDVSPEALERQERLVEHIGLQGSSHLCLPVDLAHPDVYKDALSAFAPYDIVFAANLITELDEQAIDALFDRIAPLLSESGIIVNVEAQRNYTMRQRARIAKSIERLGLHIFYPCPPSLTCPKRDCWMWRTDEFQCPDIEVKGGPIEPTKIQIANWMILCREAHSIYDLLGHYNPQLIWGVAAPYRPKFVDDKVKHKYEFCTDSGYRKGTITQDKNEWIWSLEKELFRRGTIIGITNTFDEITENWDIVSGFAAQ